MLSSYLISAVSTSSKPMLPAVTPPTILILTVVSITITITSVVMDDITLKKS